MKPKSTLRHFLALAGSSLLAISSASANTVNWNGSTSATWADAANWDTAPTADLTTDIANFNLAAYDDVTVFAPNSGSTSINGITISAGNGAMTLTTTNLSIGDGGISIANGAGALTVSGTTTLGASQSWTNNSANPFTFGAVNTGGNTLAIGGSGNTTASGIISGTNGVLTKEGAGILTLNAANSYTGATNANGGELRWGIANAIAGGALNINDGGTVNMQTFNDSVGTVTIAKGGAITGTAILTAPTLVSNNGGSISFTTGALLLNGNLTYNDTIDGSTTLSIDRLDIRSATIFNIARGDDGSGVDFDITSQIFSNANGRNITKSGSGVMRLSGATASGSVSGTHLGNGTISIQDGTLIFNKSEEVNAFGGGGLFTIGDGTGSANTAVLRYETSSNQIGGNAITINSDGLFDLNGFSESIGSALTMNGGSHTTGAGTLFLGGTTNTISGASTVTGNLTFNRSAGNANILVLGGTASINGTTTFTGDGNTGITATGNTSIAGTLVLNAASRTIAVTNASDVLTISASASGSGGMIKTGAGSLVLTSSTSNRSGTLTAQTGTLIAGANAPSGSEGAFGNASSDVNLGAAGGNNDASILAGGAFTIGRNIRNATANNSDAGTRVLTLGGNTAHVSEFSGNIFLGTTNQTSKGIQLTAAAGGQVTFSGVIQNPTGQSVGVDSEQELAAALTAVTKVGAGTAILSNSNTYTGGTTITDGVLTITGATQATNSITFTGGSLGLDTGFPVTASSAVVNLAGGTIKITGATGASSYTLLTAASITGAPVLAASVPGYELQLAAGNTELRLVQTGAASPYDTWSGGAAFDADANGDGVKNGLAFLLGAATPGTNATGLLPTTSQNGGNLVMNFACLATADRGTTSLTLEYDGDLAGTWLSVPVPGAVGAPNPIVETTTTGSVSFVATDGGTNTNGDALINVEATISDATESASGKLFGRLKAVNP